MAKLQIFSVFLTERLTLAAQEILKAVEDIFSEYNEELCRSRQEIELLRKRLQQAGLQIDSEMQSCYESQQETRTLSDEHEWTSEQHGKGTEVQMKLEVYTQQQMNRVQMSMFNESSSSLPYMNTGHDQMTNKDIESQIMDSGENDFLFTNQAADIKNEPGLHCDKGRDGQVQRFTRHSSDDSGSSDTSSGNTTEVINIDSPARKTQAFHLRHRTQERVTQHRMEQAQIRERMSSRIWPHYSQHKSQLSDCQDEASTSGKRKAHNARKAQAWRDRLKEDPVKFAEYKALEAARAKEYRRKKTAAAKESDRENNRERQRRLRAKKKLQQCEAEEEPLPSMIRKVTVEENYYILGEEPPDCL